MATPLQAAWPKHHANSALPKKPPADPVSNINNFRPPDLAAQNGRIDEIRMIPNVVKHPNRNSPPKLGGVTARSIKSREPPYSAQTGWFLAWEPSRLMKRRRATPPNLGGEFLFGCFALVHPEFPQIRSSELRVTSHSRNRGR